MSQPPERIGRYEDGPLKVRYIDRPAGIGGDTEYVRVDLYDAAREEVQYLEEWRAEAIKELFEAGARYARLALENEWLRTALADARANASERQP